VGGQVALADPFQLGPGETVRTGQPARRREAGRLIQQSERRCDRTAVGVAAASATEYPAAAISAAMLMASVVRPGEPAGPQTAMTLPRSPVRSVSIGGATTTTPVNADSTCGQSAASSTTSNRPTDAACLRSASEPIMATSRAPIASLSTRRRSFRYLSPAETRASCAPVMDSTDANSSALLQRPTIS
jgi:hypothetical protein